MKRRHQYKPHEQSGMLQDLSGTTEEPDRMDSGSDLRQRKTCLSGKIVLSVTVVVFYCVIQRSANSGTRNGNSNSLSQTGNHSSVCFCSVTSCFQKVSLRFRSEIKTNN
ncbi:Uncharacterized protein Rs2_05709 [Raphanus sativus]|nr:Uncharacterized protein Rs2_05709 [Raphanus sativus]